MKKTFAGLLALGFVAMVTAPAQAKTLAVKFVGLGSANDLSAETLAEFDDLGFDLATFNADGFDCFEMDLVDLSTLALLGRGVDCLHPMEVVLHDATGKIKRIGLEASSFFMLPGGTIVSAGTTSVQEVVAGFGDDGNVTHITGQIPTADEEDSIVASNGEFQNIKAGSVRLSGAVNLDDLLTLGEITFDCIFVIRFEIGRQGAGGGSS